MGIAEEKNALRARLKRARIDLDPQARAAQDTAICAQLVAHPAFAQAQVVLTYLSMGSEVDTHGIICAAWQQGKVVAIPRVVPGQRMMRWYEIDSFEGLVKSPFGVLEPDPGVAPEYVVNGGLRQVAVVPGFAFSHSGHRLGYGGGFYDVFLSGFDGATFGLCRPAFLDDSLVVVEPHDIAVQTVVTGIDA